MTVIKNENNTQDTCSEDLLLSSYHFDLPQELIAKRPAVPRDSSRLFCYNSLDSTEIPDRFFYELEKFLTPQSVLIFNQSSVFPCRLKVCRETGGKGEIFFLNKNSQKENHCFKAMVRSHAKKFKGMLFKSEEDPELLIEIADIHQQKDSALFDLKLFYKNKELSSLDNIEHLLKVPIPPYVRGGESDEQDKKDYQTVYAQKKGESVAAPTAGLHFTTELLQKLKERGVELLFLNLHVGLGTFSPIKVQNLNEHEMHREFYSISGPTLSRLDACYREGKEVIAVGTTTLRALESWYREQYQDKKIADFKDYYSSTNIFLKAGDKVQSINGLITNFHLPSSSLLILVSALIGRIKTLEIYQQAILKKYRFFSYGDALFIRNFKRG